MGGLRRCSGSAQQLGDRRRVASAFTLCRSSPAPPPQSLGGYFHGHRAGDSGRPHVLWATPGAALALAETCEYVDGRRLPDHPAAIPLIWPRSGAFRLGADSFFVSCIHAHRAYGVLAEVRPDVPPALPSPPAGAAVSTPRSPPFSCRLRNVRTYPKYMYCLSMTGPSC